MKALLLIIALLFSTPAWACYEPSAPLCQSSPYTFDDNYSFQTCRNELESYSSDVEEYIACLRRKQNDVVEELNSAISEFNNNSMIWGN